jgi:hypothetical protein
MSLKLLVNDPKIWESLCEELDSMIDLSYRSIERAEGNEVYRLQGSIATLKRLKLLRDKVNG